MKTFIESSMALYKSLFPRPVDVLQHLLCTLGNGIDLTRHGYLTRYRSDEEFKFGKPEPLRYVYPWSPTPKFQPFRKYVGCKECGFKEAVKYFVECLKITPDHVNNIEEWKAQAQLILDVLVDQDVPEVTKYAISDFARWKADQHIDTPTNSVTREWVFDPINTDAPEEVMKDVRDLWSAMGLGNDVYRATVCVDEGLFKEYQHLYFWLIHAGVEKHETCHVHYWW